MFQYKSKKPAASAKAISSNKSADSVRRVHFNSASCPNNRQEFNFIIQKCPIPTAIPPTSGFAAGSPRPPQNQSSPNFSDSDVDYILGELSSNNWREHIDDYEREPIVKRIFKNWKEFLELFLKKSNFESYGAEPSHTYHRPGKNETAEFHEHRDSKQMPKINRMYEGSSGIREPRKYKTDEEIKRYLRHCAAVLKINFDLKEEIQCYYDDADKEKVVYIAANGSNDENKLSALDGEQISECSVVLQRSLKGKNKSTADAGSSPIWSRFKDKLNAFLLNSSNKEKKPLLKRLVHAMKCPSELNGAKIYVIKNSDINVDISGLHAERKILYYLRSQKSDEDVFLDPLRLGGIRRPCFVCSALCFSDMSQVRPGPCWASIAASTPKDIKEMFLILDAIRNENNTTYMTDNNGHPDTAYDTESGEGSACDQDTN